MDWVIKGLFLFTVKLSLSLLDFFTINTKDLTDNFGTHLIAGPDDLVCHEFLLFATGFLTVEMKKVLKDWSPDIQILQFTLTVDHTTKDGKFWIRLQVLL